jgi:hypothetical protein
MGGGWRSFRNTRIERKTGRARSGTDLEKNPTVCEPANENILPKVLVGGC